MTEKNDNTTTQQKYIFPSWFWKVVVFWIASYFLFQAFQHYRKISWRGENAVIYLSDCNNKLFEGCTAKGVLKNGRFDGWYTFETESGREVEFRKDIGGGLIDKIEYGIDKKVTIHLGSHTVFAPIISHD